MNKIAPTLTPEQVVRGLRTHTVAYVYGGMPPCAFHEEREADYDARIGHRGPWGFLCQDCFDELTEGALGMGRGQRLLLAEE
jgi:hypothetical protein